MGLLTRERRVYPRRSIAVRLRVATLAKTVDGFTENVHGLGDRGYLRAPKNPLFKPFQIDTYCGNRQQTGLHGASPGGQPFAKGKPAP